MQYLYLVMVYGECIYPIKIFFTENALKKYVKKLKKEMNKSPYDYSKSCVKIFRQSLNGTLKLYESISSILYV